MSAEVTLEFQSNGESITAGVDLVSSKEVLPLEDDDDNTCDQKSIEDTNLKSDDEEEKNIDSNTTGKADHGEDNDIVSASNTSNEKDTESKGEDNKIDRNLEPPPLEHDLTEGKKDVDNVELSEIKDTKMCVEGSETEQADEHALSQSEFKFHAESNDNINEETPEILEEQKEDAEKDLQDAQLCNEKDSSHIDTTCPQSSSADDKKCELVADVDVIIEAKPAQSNEVEPSNIQDEAPDKTNEEEAEKEAEILGDAPLQEENDTKVCNETNSSNITIDNASRPTCDVENDLGADVDVVMKPKSTQSNEDEPSKIQDETTDKMIEEKADKMQKY